MITKRMKPLFWIVLVLLLVTLACGTGTDTATDEPTLGDEVVTEVPMEEPAETSSSEVVVADEPYHLEEFDGGLEDWFYFSNVSDEKVEEFTEFYTDDGGLWFKIDDEDTYVYLINNVFEYGDVQLEVEAESLGRNNNYISLICRYDENIGWYEFNIAANGLVSIYRYDYDDGYITIGEGGSDAIQQGVGTNTFIAECDGDALTLTINGKEWRTFHDKTIKNGLIGLSAGSMNVTPVEIVFNWMNITEP